MNQSKEIPSWLDKDGIQIAKKINNNKGKAHAINYLAEMAKGRMSNKLVWAKDFYDKHIK